MTRRYTKSDAVVARFDILLSGVSGVLFPRVQQPNPAQPYPEVELTEAESRSVEAMMRINHVGEVCAQALYTGQALATKPSSLQRMLREAGREEEDHLAWTSERLDELKGRKSVLNPLWYVGALSIGVVAGLAGDRYSLGFIKETEEQVEAHLDQHLELMPSHDERSKAIVAQMKEDEIRHANTAQQQGAAELPMPIRLMMKAASKAMTSVAKHI